MRRAAAFLMALAICVLAPAGAAFAASAPTIEYGAVSPIRNHEATLHFSINPNGLVTQYEVEYARVGEEVRDWGMYGEIPAGEEPVAAEVKLPRYWEAASPPGRNTTGGSGPGTAKGRPRGPTSSSPPPTGRSHRSPTARRPRPAKARWS